MSVQVVRDESDPAHIVLFERWGEKADQQRYQAWRQEHGGLPSLADDSVAPPKVTFFEELPGV